ncbi:MAG TPA: hypothetical protein VHI13_21440 [Candidatus Kapabacteria bacterium]|nr:hypothetical protein [Candidatus Kapabacteria bacterium]
MKPRTTAVLFLCLLAATPMSAQTARTIFSSAQPITALEWSRDGTRITFAEGNGTLTIWSVPSDAIAQTFTASSHPITSIHSRPGTAEIGFPLDDGIGIWNRETNTLRTIPGTTGPVREIAWSPDGMKVASACGNGTSKRIVIWNAENGAQILELDTADRGNSCTDYQVAWDPDGSRILGTGSCGDIGTFYNPATGGELGHLGQPYGILAFNTIVKMLSYSPDGTLVAAGHYFNYIAIHDSKGGVEMHRLTYDSIGLEQTMAWCPTDSLIVSGDRDGVITMWTTKIWRPLKIFRGHRGAINALAWSRDGRQFASCGNDGKVKIWNTADAVSAVESGTVAEAVDGMEAFPNPARGLLHVRYRSRRAGRVTVSLADVRGALVLTSDDHASANGTEEILLDLGSLNTGPCMLQLRLPDGTVLHQVMVVIR